jgi:hypothetical protein
MERDTNTHGPRVDDEMAREVAALTHGARVESRIEEERLPENAGDDNDALGGETEPPTGHARHVRFYVRFDWRHRLAAAVFGVTQGNAFVELTPDSNGGSLHASFGFWQLKTPLRNVAAVERSGSYSILKTIGPARLSFSDRGITFAGNDEAGVCIRFAHPVPAIDPLGLVLHPGLTVTVEDGDALVAAIERMRSA